MPEYSINILVSSAIYLIHDGQNIQTQNLKEMES